MRLICPHCMSGVTVADDTAGKEATCPNCGRSFPTPARYSAAVVPEAAAAIASTAAAAPPGSVPPTPPPIPAAASAATPPPGFVPPAPPTPDGFLPSSHAAGPALAGYTHARGITISPKVVAWLPAALLTVVFVLTFFPWVGSYVGGSAVYSQRPWNALYGGVSSNPPLAKAVKIPTEWRDKLRSDWELMTLYLFLLVIVVALVWAERALGDVPPRQIPPLAKIWPHRHAAILALGSVILLLSVIQVANGFGMERAVRKSVSEKFAAARQQAGTSEAALADIEYDTEQEYAKYNLERATWAYLALLCNALAVAAVVTHLALEKRGNKPAPKILLHY